MGFVALDYVHHAGSRWFKAGGTAANVAAIFRHLGGSSSIAGRLGADQAGRLVLTDLKLSGVRTRRLTLNSDVSTPVVIHRIEAGKHSYSFRCPACGERYGRFQPPTHHEAHLDADEGGMFFFDRATASSLTAAEIVARNGGLVVFEPSVPGQAELFSRAVSLAHIVKFSRQRQTKLAAFLAEPRPGQLRIVTRAGEGLEFAFGYESPHFLPAFPASVVDTAGGGDWTTAGLLTWLAANPGRLQVDQVEYGLRFGQALASINCSWAGARGAMAIEARRLKWSAITLMRGAPIDVNSNGRAEESSNALICRRCIATV